MHRAYQARCKHAAQQWWWIAHAMAGLHRARSSTIPRQPSDPGGKCTDAPPCAEQSKPDAHMHTICRSGHAAAALHMARSHTIPERPASELEGATPPHTRNASHNTWSHQIVCRAARSYGGLSGSEKIEREVEEAAWTRAGVGERGVLGREACGSTDDKVVWRVRVCVVVRAVRMDAAEAA